MSPDETSAALAAASFVSMALAATSDTPANIFEGLQASGVLEEADPTAVNHFLSTAVGARVALKETLQRARLAAATIPAFSALDTSIDLRLSFRDNAEVRSTVPVALIHIDTDEEDHEIFFQMSKDQLEKAIEKLRTALVRLEAAERWAGSKT